MVHADNAGEKCMVATNYGDPIGTWSDKRGTYTAYTNAGTTTVVIVCDTTEFTNHNYDPTAWAPQLTAADVERLVAVANEFAPQKDEPPDLPGYRPPTTAPPCERQQTDRRDDVKPARLVAVPGWPGMPRPPP